MKVIDDLLSSLSYDVSVQNICQGPFQTAVLTRNCGLASTPHDPGPHHNRTPVGEAGRLMEHDAQALAGMARSESPFEAAIGMATINSLIKVDEHKCHEINAGDLLSSKGNGKKVAIVGHFPFVTRLRKVAQELWIIERNPEPGDYTEEEAGNIIPRADVIGITGTALTNHTFEQLIGMCSPGAYVVVLGGTAPLSPVLFDYGVSAISGTRVADPEMVFRCVGQGATFRQLRGVHLLTMER